MPKVPFTNNVVPMQPEATGSEPGPTQLAMAAVLMHQEGRLIDQTKTLPKQADDAQQ